MSDFNSYFPSDLPVPAFHGLLLGAISPRPIAFASTIDKEGNVNLSPFSFFNVFGANPPTLIFSPARRVRDNTIKHTLENVKEVKEVVINMVSYSMVEQMSLSSTEYEKGVNEFFKAGFTPIDSETVSPPRVLESPAQFECVVREIVETGQEGGAGNLIICEVKKMHISKAILDEDGKIDPHLLDAVARMGGNYYCRASGDAVFEVAKPLTTKGIGVDELPYAIRTSKFLSGNTLGKLGNVEKMPTKSELESIETNFSSEEEKHKQAEELAQKGEVMKAWAVLLS
ncbi:flavin reductase family protein [Bernardetia sp.]|uniref:flavin reductase family protein n=1 Tax=Bernardetia sp. TaxID=1937974 RepID=UPI0025BC2593|nr:flavin reductase family protein [Bernardetia sp.]